MAEAARPLPDLPDAAAFRAWAEHQPERWQFINGNLVMMAGGTLVHARLSANLLGLLWNRLRGKPCQPYPSDLAVRIDLRNEFYPDVVVDCGQARNEAAAPVLVVEVLSPSTEADDRGRKWAAYRRLPMLRHYMLVAQDTPLVEVYSRRDEVWTLHVIERLDGEVALPSLELTLPMAEIYEGVRLEAGTAQ
jgi:Uma2 family endonuclease